MDGLLFHPTEIRPADVPKKLAAEKLKSGESYIEEAVGVKPEWRMLGMKITMEWRVNEDDGSVSTSLNLDYVRHLGSVEWGRDETSIKHPLLSSMQCSLVADVLPGEDMLVAILTPRDVKSGRADPGQRFLVLAKFDVAEKEVPRSKQAPRSKDDGTPDNPFSQLE